MVDKSAAYRKLLILGYGKNNNTGKSQQKSRKRGLVRNFPRLTGVP